MKSSEDKILESFENYLRIKFLDFKNQDQTDKKLKTYKKELNHQFKDKIDELKNLALEQEKFNSLVSKLISNMSFDENIEEEEKREEENENEEKQSKPKDQEQKSSKKDEQYEEMSIESGIPDLDNKAKESDIAEEELQRDDGSDQNFKKREYYIRRFKI